MGVVYTIQKKREATGPALLLYLLDNSSFFECCVCTVFGNSAKSLCRNFDSHVFIKLCDVNPFLVEVWSTLCFTRRVKLRRTSAIAVSATNLGFLSRDFTFFCHIVLL